MQTDSVRKRSTSSTRARCAVHGIVHSKCTANPEKTLLRDTGTKEWRTVIVDSHSMVRAGLRMLLASHEQISVIGEAADGLSAVSEVNRLRPDLVIMDMVLPSLHGIDVIAAIVRRSPATRVVVLSACPSESQAAGALSAGAHGYVLKQSCPSTLTAALQTVQAKQQCFVDPQLNPAKLSISKEMICLSNKPGTEARFSVTRDGLHYPALASRERQVLKLIAEGATNVDIADQLTISRKTVETHRLNVMRKLKAHSTAELSCWAFRIGLTSL